jgi:fructokinase
MKKSNLQILCFGEALWDQFPDGPQAGGAPMNVAIHLQKLGCDVSFISKVGKDELGKKLIAFIDSSGLRTNHIQIDPELKTSEVLVHVDKKKNATYEIVKPVAWDNIELYKQMVQLCNAVSCVVYGSLAARSGRSYKTLLQLLNNKAIKVMDVNLRHPYFEMEVLESLILKADILKMNDEELSILSQGADELERLKWISNKYKVELIVLTKGSEGAMVYQKGQLYQHHGFRVNVIDTVGSGDAFLAGFLSQYLRGESISASLSFGNALGALIASRIGASADYSLDNIAMVQFKPLFKKKGQHKSDLK